jgi:hypothetical protein
VAPVGQGRGTENRLLKEKGRSMLPLSQRRSSFVSKIVLVLFVTLGAMFGPIGMVGADSASNAQKGAADGSGTSSAELTEKPNPKPTKEPKPEPTEEPAEEPDEEPTEEPKPEPTKEPKPEPTKEPKPEPTEEPAETPAEAPIASPAAAPAVDAAASSPAGQPERPPALRQAAAQPNPGPPSTNGVQPVFIGGNPDCADLGFTEELRVDPAASGTFSDGTLTVTTTIGSVAQGPVVAWTSNIAVLGVIIKGGPNANFYDYGAGSTGDGNLHAPVNPNNNMFYGLSHFSFCYGETPPPETGTIIINKDAIPDSTQGFGYTGTLGGFTLVDDGTGTQSSMVFTDLDAGDYDVTETGPPAGWNLTEISCQDPSGGTTTAGNTASIDLAVGETVLCTFINEQVPPPTPPPSPPPSPPNGGGGGAGGGGAGGGAGGGDGGGAATGTGLAFTGLGLVGLALTTLFLLMTGGGFLAAGRRTSPGRGRHRRTSGRPPGLSERPQLKRRRTTGLGFTGSGFLPLALTTVALVVTGAGLVVARNRSTGRRGRHRRTPGRRPRQPPG